jgi:hypothetical protein
MEPPLPTARSPVREAVFDLSLFTKTPDLKTSPGAKGFLDLPPELRNHIYKLATLKLVDYRGRKAPPGARVVPNIALALTCRQVYKEHITRALVAHRRHSLLGILEIRRPPNTGLRWLEISLSREYPSTRIIEILGIDVVDRFDRISIVGKWDLLCPRGDCWSRGKDFYSLEIKHQIGLAGGPLAFGWQGDPEAFYKRATFEKKMERADFFWMYGTPAESYEAQRRHPALFLKYAHSSVRQTARGVL